MPIKLYPDIFFKKYYFNYHKKLIMTALMQTKFFIKFSFYASKQYKSY